MNINNLRASTIGTYKDCPFKFFLQYVVGFPSVSGKKANLGTISHYVLETLAKAKKRGRSELYSSKSTNPEWILSKIWPIFTKDYPDHEYCQEDYDFCLEQVQNVLNSKYNPLKLNVIRTEHQFEIEANIPGFSYDYTDYLTQKNKTGNMALRGTIDLITEAAPDTLEVIDYKTGQRSDWITGSPKEWEDFFKDIQLRMYDLATSKLYPQYKYRMLTIIFTRDGGPFSISFEPEDIQDTLDSFRKMYRQILNDSKISRLKDNKDKRDQIWKCDYVCQFGLVNHYFSNPEGDIIKRQFKRISKKSKLKRDYPTIITIGEVDYERISFDEETDCDIFYKKLRTKGVHKTYHELHQITIGQTGEVSRRNDYNNSKISRIKLDDHNEEKTSTKN